ncbi:phosphoribosyltransferase-like protein [Burkholderia vietnamiensis]|uniref:phosphoribosyltransferase-like protein n=1 Tax=Burkholderia vietnamiensis TaxID=60552 RepID=UPI001D13DE3E|nr:hypothetical protein [Burkholderia vietnamiensis]UEC02576.1 hypothetical protein LK462_11390 [Burkholderia vietnamiensis]
MHPTNLDSESQIEVLREVIRKTPFLDLSWHFDGMLDFEARCKQLRAHRPTVQLGMNFEEFAASRRVQRSELAQFVANVINADGDESQKLFDDIELYADFIVGLDPSEAVANSLIDYYAHLGKFIETACLEQSDPSGYRSVIVSLTLDPVLRWCDHKEVNAEVALQILKPLESAIHASHGRLTLTSFNTHQLEMQNNLKCCYFVLAGVLKSTLHPVVVSDHLLIFRRTSAALWNQVDPRIRMQYATLVLHMSLVFFPPEEPFTTKMGFSLNTLADLRNVFRDAAGAAIDARFTVHRWVFSWFAEKLDAEVFSWRAVKASYSSLSMLSEGEQNMVVELAQRFAGYRLPVTAHHIANFLLQFETTERIHGALRLLNHSKFFPLWELGEAMERLLTAEIGVDSNQRLVVTPLGDQTGSTAIIRYLASHSKLSGSLVFAQDIEEALDQTAAGDKLCFVDDCLLSGTQTLNILGDLTGARVRKQHHTKHCDVLSSAYLSKLSERTLIFAYCVAVDYGIERFNSKVNESGINPEKVVLRYGVVEPGTSKAFEPMGPVVWSSARQRDALKDFSAEVGYEILKSRAERKGWDDDRRRESALGFSDFQRLLIFPYNVPKTTVTLLWEEGSDSREWKPLFPGFD